MTTGSLLNFRDAEPADQLLLETWLAAPHVRANVPDEDWEWARELPRKPAWRKQWISELDERPVGFVQIIDAAAEETHYWGNVAANTAAIDIWIGEVDCIGRGVGTQMMTRAINFCFGWRSIDRIVIDPLAANVAGRRFYERLGFRLLELRRFGDDQCAVYELRAQDWADRGITPSSALRACSPLGRRAFTSP